MKRKKGKPVNFDVIMKFFIQHYDIPTRTDIEKIMKRLDHLEKLIKASGAAGRKGGTGESKKRPARGKGDVTAADAVLAVIDGHKSGATVADVRSGTGFDEKKVRNILYRLHKMKRIDRRGRGVYTLC